MTREEKIIKRKEKRAKRKIKRRDRNKEHMRKLNDFQNTRPSLFWYQIKAAIKHGSWADSSSPTGYSQVCCYSGICQSPCNGDC